MIDTLIGSKNVGQAAAVGTALHIVLTTQGIEASAGFTNMPGHERKIGQGKGVICAVCALADAHAPINRGAACLCVETGSSTNIVRRNAAYGFCPFWSEGFQ